MTASVPIADIDQPTSVFSASSIDLVPTGIFYESEYIDTEVMQLLEKQQLLSIQPEKSPSATMAFFSHIIWPPYYLSDAVLWSDIFEDSRQTTPRGIVTFKRKPKILASQVINIEALNLKRRKPTIGQLSGPSTL